MRLVHSMHIILPKQKPLSLYNPIQHGSMQGLQLTMTDYLYFPDNLGTMHANTR